VDRRVRAAPGKPTSTKAADCVVVPSGWTGKLPDAVKRIDASKPYVWMIGRTQTNGPTDYDAVHKDSYRITPLSQWGGPPKPASVKIDPTVDMKTPPFEQVNKMPAAQHYSAELMKLNPPHATD
jgi:hypothetical protein